jgi:signal transduction histidine kinase/ActR/RegA family two-component response regulator
MQVFDHETRFVLSGGRVRTMHLISVPRRLDDNRIVWDGVVTDVTERLLAAESRRALELQLREAQKMESIGTLASGIAHDFNNVLASILGNAAMAREDARASRWSETTRALDQIFTAAERARDLVRQILTFSRKQAPTRVVQLLAPIVEEHLAMLRAALPANVEVAAGRIDPGVAAQVDRTQFGQVLLNLCTNAWHAMGEHGGSIDVGLDTVTLAAESAVPLGLGPGRYARLWVEDTGCGMDEATRKRIFEPFFTTKPVGTGTGLGLSVVHGIVQSHEGAIRLTSSPGSGSRFEVLLPAFAPVDAPAQAIPDPHGGQVFGHGQRVLYLDDDEVMALMVERLLTRANFSVTCLRDSDEALALFAQDPGRFDILVTDYNMPKHSGLEVVRRFLTLRPGLPALISSGYVSGELLALAKALGVSEVLEKQNTFEELAGAVERALLHSAGARHSGAAATL